MNSESLWLGRMRQPVRLAMIASLSVLAALALWFMLNKMFAAEAVGMHELIRPKGRPLVAITLIVGAVAFLLTSIYLSDTRGPIEDEARGFFDILSLVTSRMAMIMIALTVGVMFYEVIARYMFSRPTLWANELSLWLAAFVFLFAGQYAMQQRSHIRIYVLYDKMPRWGQKFADVLSIVMLLTFTFALVWGGFGDAWTRMMRMETFGTAWDPPIPGVLKPAILFIIVLVSVQAVSNLIADWHKAPVVHSDEPDAEEIEIIRRSLEK